MRSAYGFDIPAEDYELTHVEAGSPMGELMRRYWQPVCLSDEIKDLPRRVKLLCEDLVAFRDKQGRAGVMHLHCSHRGTSLEFGRVEENGIRCCYHGWLYRTDGKCIEMPCEQPGYAERMDIWQPSYPVHEYGGVVFAYMGPPQMQPLFPMYDIIDTRHRNDMVLKGMRLWEDHAVGYVRDCNWLQHMENAADPWHLVVLHEMISGDQFASVLTQGRRQKIGAERTDLGMRYMLLRELPNGLMLDRHSECIVPNVVLIASIHQKGEKPMASPEKVTEVTWLVPSDNEHVHGISIVAWPLKDGAPDPKWVPGTYTISDIRPGQLRERTYEDKQRKPDDMEAQEGQRPITIHALEHLAVGDTGVALLRNTLRKAIRDMQAGRDPLNVIRDPAKNHALETKGWNWVMTKEEAARRFPQAAEAAE